MALISKGLVHFSFKFGGFLVFRSSRKIVRIRSAFFKGHPNLFFGSSSFLCDLIGNVLLGLQVLQRYVSAIHIFSVTKLVLTTVISSH